MLSRVLRDSMELGVSSAWVKLLVRMRIGTPVDWFGGVVYPDWNPVPLDCFNEHSQANLVRSFGDIW